MQKVFNILSIISFGVVTIGTAAGLHVYMNREAIIDNVKDELSSIVMETVSNMDLDLPMPTNAVPPAPVKPVSIPVEPF